MTQLKIEEVIDRVLSRKMARLRTSLPGVIKDFDPVACEASVVQTVWDYDEEGSPIAPSVITHVPVAFFGVSDSRMTYKVRPGDKCLIVFCGSAIDTYKASGVPGAPRLRRKHHLTDAVALMFAIANKDRKPTSTEGTVIEGADIRIGGEDALGVPTKASVDALRQSLNDLVSAFKTHTHVAPGGSTGIPNNAASVSLAAAIVATAAARLK